MKLPQILYLFLMVIYVTGATVASLRGDHIRAIETMVCAIFTVLFLTHVAPDLFRKKEEKQND